MKKTLIALAAVAATSASFAQVTLSGSVAYGYQATKSNTAAVAAVAANVPGTDGHDATKASTLGSAAVAAATGVKASGFGVDTAAFTMAASEDLGGGLKLAGSMSLGGLTRGDTPTGEDFKMVLSGGFGTVMLGQIKIGSGIRGLAQAGAPVNNMEGEVLSAAVNSDIVKYTAPKFGDFTLSGSFTEGVGLATGIKANDVKGPTALTLGVDYAAGPMAAKFDISNWSNHTKDSRYRLAGSYDLGVAKIGAGFERTKFNAGTNSKETILGVSAPVGTNVTVGAVWTQRKPSNAAKVSGTTLGAKYSLSKRTNVTANTASWKTEGAASATKTTILLNHSF